MAIATTIRSDARHLHRITKDQEGAPKGVFAANRASFAAAG
jgi:hypothetical protein